MSEKTTTLHDFANVRRVVMKGSLTRIAWYKHIGVCILRIKSNIRISHKNGYLLGEMS